MAAKIFEVGDVLPATTQLRISWSDMDGGGSTYPMFATYSNLKSDNDSFRFFIDNGSTYHLCGIAFYNWDCPPYDFISIYTAPNGIHPYMDIDTSNWSLEKRTISSYVNSSYNYIFNLSWEDVAPSGFSITFEENGGTSVTDLSGQTALPDPLPTTTKSGYTFLGWYYDSSFTNAAVAGDSLSSDVTLYAKWQLNTYTISYNSNGGSSIPQTSDATQLPNPLPIPTRTGYYFQGWYYDSDFTNEAFADDPLTGDVTLYAKWGLTSGPKIFEVGDVLPATTQLRISWSDMDGGGSTYPMFATYSNLKSDNDSFRFFIDNGSTYHLCGIAFYNWDCPPYDFISIYTAPNGIHPYMDIDTSNWSLEKRTISSYVNSSYNYIFNLSWEDVAPSGFSITFEENGGTSVTDLSGQTALPDPLPTTTKSGYTFLGWYYDSSFTNAAVAGDSLSSDVTLYAKWQLNTYTISYNSNGGSSIPQTSDATQLPNPLPIPTRTGYYFQGWYYDSDFTNEAFADDPLTGDVTLYAKWGLTSGPKIFEVGDVLPATTQLRISWSDMDGGGSTYPMFATYSNLKSDNDSFRFFIDNGSTYHLCGIAFYNWDCPPYDFISIYTAPNGIHPYMDIDTSNWSLEKRTISSYVNSSYNYIFNLSWEDVAPSGFSITFEENGGTSVTDLSGQTVLPTPLPTPTRSGYTFVAWYYESNFQTRAVAGATIEEDTTLYAKWHNLGSLFTEIADAIRSKDGTSENIRDVDFGERVKQIQGAKEEETKTVTPNFSSGNIDVTPTTGKVLSQVTINKDANFIAENLKKDVTAFGLTGTSYIAIELTQAQYDALGTKDANTYYLITE